MNHCTINNYSRLRVFNFLIVFILVYPFNLYSQDSKNNTKYNFQSLEIQINKGLIIPHDDTLKPLKNGYISDFELNYKWFVNGTKAWHNFQNNPQLGITLKFIDLNKPKVLGKAFGIIPTISYSLIELNKVYSNIRLGLGLSYLTNKYDKTTNPSNVAISTSLNLIGSIRFEIGYNITERLGINCNINATHISNGAIKKPNYGLNIITYGFGANLRFNNAEFNSPKQFEIPKNKPYLSISFYGGIKEVGSAGGPKYFPITSQISTIKPFRFFEIGTGLDIIYDKSARYYIRKEQMKYSSPNDDFHIGYFAKALLLLDKLSFFGDLGIYLYKPNPQFPIIYQRIGMKYTLMHNLSLTMGLKTHLNIADHIDWGINIKL